MNKKAIIAFFAALGAGLLWFVGFFLNVKKEKTKVQLKENENEAETIVKNKTAGELVDDFNRRYPSDGSGKNDSGSKG